MPMGKSWKNVPRPTHFLSLRCMGAIPTIEQLQAKLVAHDPLLLPFCQRAPPSRAHLSLLMLNLDGQGMEQSRYQCTTERDVRSMIILLVAPMAGAAATLASLKEALLTAGLLRPLALQMRGLGTFGDGRQVLEYFFLLRLC